MLFCSHTLDMPYQLWLYHIPSPIFMICLFWQFDLEGMEDLSDMRNELMERVQNVMTKACDYRNSFDTYAYLWVDDRNEFMRQFLIYNHVLTTEEIEAHAEDGVPECPPTLHQFKEQVKMFVAAG